MKLAVFSDSHGNPAKMLQYLSENPPDLMLHLGDGAADVLKIKKRFPHLPLRAVKGNCDFGSGLPETEVFFAGPLKIMMTHGHIYGVKRSLLPLVDEAKARGAGLVVYGHTHIPNFTMEGGLYVLNPGSCGFPPRQSCALVSIDKKGEPLCQFLWL
jgi:putative phosphoesterase